MNRSTPGLPVHQQLPESTHTHVHWVGDSIQPSHPLSSPSPALSLSQCQDFFQWVNFSHEVAKVLEFQFQHQSFQWTPRTGFPYDGLVGSPCSPRDSQESSPTPQFKSINSSALSFLDSPTLTSIHDYWKNQSLFLSPFRLKHHFWLFWLCLSGHQVSQPSSPPLSPSAPLWVFIVSACCLYHSFQHTVSCPSMTHTNASLTLLKWCSLMSLFNPKMFSVSSFLF